SISMETVDDTLPRTLNEKKADNLILGVALSLKKKKQKVVLVSKDTNLRIKADALGIEAQDYERGKIHFEEFYSGWRSLKIESSSLIDKLYAEKKLPISEIDKSLEVHPNQFFLLESIDGTSKSALCRYENNGSLTLLEDIKPIWGISPRNKEQRFALDLLMNDKISLVTLVGKAGTGKTLLAIAAGLYKVADEKSFKKLLVTRPIFPLGKELGFLPGELEEKLRPWMQPIFDNLELLLHLTDSQKKSTPYKELTEHGILQIEALTYIRGRSIPNEYIIVDEAQNLTPHEVKTILTRAGEKTKVILTGDPYQIDNPYVDASSNGLTYVAEKFKDLPIAGHITLTKGERSQLAEAAANML
ncbi:MAG: PhoH family protein, partial [Acidobacteria bacterium]|nr:PhoH family protein [Acidobacteriota bacterium]